MTSTVAARSLLPALALCALLAAADAGCSSGDTALTAMQCRGHCARHFNSRQCRTGSSCSKPLFESTCCRRSATLNSCGLADCYCSVDKINGAGLGVIIGSAVLALLLLLLLCCLCRVLFKKCKYSGSSSKSNRSHTTDVSV
jgi:hypothetical protein